MLTLWVPIQFLGPFLLSRASQLNYSLGVVQMQKYVIQVHDMLVLTRGVLKYSVFPSSRRRNYYDSLLFGLRDKVSKREISLLAEIEIVEY